MQIFKISPELNFPKEISQRHKGHKDHKEEFKVFVH